MTIANLVVDVFANTAALNKSVGEINGKLDSVNSVAKRMAGVLAGAFTIGAVVSFGRELIAMADTLVRVADRTGLTTEEVQKLQHIAKQSGNTIDEMTSALGKLQVNLSSGNAGTVGAVKALGINLETLKAASPYEQMEMLATKIAQLPNPLDRSRVAMELFGRGGMAILPTLVANFSALGEAAPVMSDKTTRALDEAGDALDTFTLQLKVWAAESYNWAGKAFDQLVVWAFQAVAGLFNATAAIFELTAKIPGASFVMEKLGISTKGLREQAQWYTDAANAQIATINQVETATRKTVGPTLDLGDANTASAKAAKAAEQALQAQVASMAGYRSSGVEAARAVAQAFGGGLNVLRQMGIAIGSIRSEYVNLADNIRRVPISDVPGMLNLDSTSGPMIGRLMKGLGQQAGQGFMSGLRPVLESIPQTIANAFTGGGGLIGAAKAIAVQMGTVFYDTLTDAITRAIKKGTSAVSASSLRSAGALGAMAGIGALTAGGTALQAAGSAAMAGVTVTTSAWAAGTSGAIALGVATAGIGLAAIGAYYGLKKLFGATELDKVNKLRGEFLASAGGLDALGLAALESHGSLELVHDVLNAKTVQDYNRAVINLNEAVRIGNELNAKRLQLAAAQLELSQQQIQNANNVIAGVAPIARTARDLDNLGMLAVASFAAARAAGLSMVDAIAAAAPGLQTLREAYDRLGISTNNVLLNTLMLQSTMLTNNPALLTAVNSLGDSFSALAALGMLNADTFRAMEETGLEMYSRLQGEAASLGGGTADALLPMQDYLHRAERAAADLGIPLDDNTQRLIDQSKELGIWKESGKTATDKMIDAMNILVQSINDLTKSLQDIPNITRTVTVRTVYVGDPPPGGEETPALSRSFGPSFGPSRMSTSRSDGRTSATTSALERRIDQLTTYMTTQFRRDVARAVVDAKATA